MAADKSLQARLEIYSMIPTIIEIKRLSQTKSILYNDNVDDNCNELQHSVSKCNLNEGDTIRETARRRQMTVKKYIYLILQDYGVDLFNEDFNMDFLTDKNLYQYKKKLKEHSQLINSVLNKYFENYILLDIKLHRNLKKEQQKISLDKNVEQTTTSPNNKNDEADAHDKETDVGEVTYQVQRFKNISNSKVVTTNFQFASNLKRVTSQVVVSLADLEIAIEQILHKLSITWVSSFDLLLPERRYLREKTEDFGEYLRRLQSFLHGRNERKKHWSNDKMVLAGPLADAGFCYEGEDDIVVCKHCDCKSDTSKWRDNDETYAFQMHKNGQKKHCQFLELYDSCGSCQNGLPSQDGDKNKNSLRNLG